MELELVEAPLDGSEHPAQKELLEEIQRALISEDGIMTATAAKLEMNLKMLQNFLKKFPELEDLRQQLRESLLDETEGQLVRAIRAGESWAVQFMLSTQGKNRGYHRKLELEGNFDVTHHTGVLKAPARAESVDDWEKTNAIDVEVS